MFLTTVNIGKCSKYDYISLNNKFYIEFMKFDIITSSLYQFVINKKME